MAEGIMFRKILLAIVTILFIFGIGKLSFAMMCGGHTSHQQTAQEEHAEYKHMEHEDVSEATPQSAVSVGNKICPVSGDKIDEKTKATYEYEGKIYNFCCASCIDEFKKDPDKYIKKVDEELKSESEAESKEYMMMPESEMSGGM